MEAGPSLDSWDSTLKQEMKPNADCLHARPISALLMEKREAGGAGALAPWAGQLGMAPQSDLHLLMESREKRQQRTHSRKDRSSERGTLGKAGPCRCARLSLSIFQHP